MQCMEAFMFRDRGADYDYQCPCTHRFIFTGYPLLSWHCWDIAVGGREEISMKFCIRLKKTEKCCIERNWVIPAFAIATCQ